MSSVNAGNSKIDVDGLLQLAREKSIDGRKALLRAISDLFEGRSEELNERETTLMHAILHQLVSDTEKEVRFEALAWLKDNSKTAHLPVIALSANALPMQVARGNAAGFAAYLTKPIDILEVTSRLKVFLSEA